MATREGGLLTSAMSHRSTCVGALYSRRHHVHPCPPPLSTDRQASKSTPAQTSLAVAQRHFFPRAGSGLRFCRRRRPSSVLTAAAAVTAAALAALLATALPSTVRASDTPVVPSQRLALVDLYKTTGGSSWTEAWPIDDPSSDPCVHNWHGITCTGGEVR